MSTGGYSVYQCLISFPVAVASATSSFDLESDAAGLTDRVAAQGMDGSITLGERSVSFVHVWEVLFNLFVRTSSL